MAKLDVFVIYGGRSAERDVSVGSACSVIKYLNREKYNVYPVYIDEDGVFAIGQMAAGELSEAELRMPAQGGAAQSAAKFLSALAAAENPFVFPVLHGTFGEDGKIQGLFEMADVPYSGCGVLGSASSMDKVAMKGLFSSAGISQGEYLAFDRYEYTSNLQTVLSAAANMLPAYIKPANLGSSVGISRADSVDELKAALELAFKYDRRVLVEREVVGREVTVALLGNNEIICSVCGEWQHEEDFFDYDDKYLTGETVINIPVELDDAVYKNIRGSAVAAYKALDCSGLCRADFFIADNGRVLLNELNSLPGFSDHSMYPLLMEHEGFSYSALCDKLIELGLERFETARNLIYRR